MSEKITQVEAAIAEAVIGTGDREFVSKLGLFLAGNPGLIGRAAIQAMKIPTEPMIDSRMKGLSSGDANANYQFMVEAALGYPSDWSPPKPREE